MPDGPRYEDDFYAWTQHQAEVVRTMPVSDNRFDREHVAEEIEDLGKSERDAVRRRLIEGPGVAQTTAARKGQIVLIDEPRFLAVSQYMVDAVEQLADSLNAFERAP